jgi:arabinogalactan endo-1,4-beta-galactosidase
MRHFNLSGFRWLAATSLLLLNACHSSDSTPAPVVSTTAFYRGADLSFTPEAEASGVTFTDGGQITTTLAALQRHGGNLVRLRLWHTPAAGHSGLAEVTAFAHRAKQAGLAVLLDIHYADSWADPSQQPTPAAWQNLPLATLQDSVYGYTRHVLQVLTAQQARPDLVQIGNEINGGMLWPQGQVRSESDYPTLAALLSKGLAAVAAENAGAATPIRTVVHYAGAEYAASFFSQLAQLGVRPDVQGLSYYPLYHGRDLAVCQQQLTALVQQTSRDVLVVETSYPFTLAWNDYTNNQLGTTSQLVPGFAATPAGQQAFLTDLSRRLKALPGGHGIGFCYWAPEWVAWHGSTATDGSPWENQTLFDFNNAALPAWAAFAP